MKLNNKGYMLVEIVVASAIAFSIGFYLMNLTYKFKNTNDDIYESRDLNNIKINVIKNIMNSLENEKIISFEQEGNELKIYTDSDKDGVDSELYSTLTVSNKEITYNVDDLNNKFYSFNKKIDEYGYMNINCGGSGCIFLNSNFAQIDIPINSIYSNEGINIKFVLESELDKSNYFYAENIECFGGNTVDTGIYLFSEENKNKDFEISFKVSNFQYDENQPQATIMNAMDESNESYPGIIFRLKKLTNNTFQFVKEKKSYDVSYDSIKDKEVVIVRKNGDISYKIDNVAESTAEKEATSFDTPVTFCSSVDKDNKSWRFFTGTLSDVTVKIEDN